MKAFGALIKAIGELVFVGAAVWLGIFFPWFAEDGITGKRAITATIAACGTQTQRGSRKDLAELRAVIA
jgi:hypothetical protein